MPHTPFLRERFNRWLDTLDTRISIAIHAVTWLASFALPAWAVWAADLFAQYAPVSWVIAGFLGIVVITLARMGWALASRMLVRSRYDRRSIERVGEPYNPLDLTFERRRIYLEDFVL